MRGLESGREVLRKLQWRRGLRAGLAVAAAMIVCRALGRPMGWAALGAFEVILVDNGGPYRSRLATMSTVLAGGAVACVLGAMAPGALWGAALLTAVVCFVVTFARVISQPIASTSVIILVIYFAGYGGENHTLSAAIKYATEYLLAGVWGGVLGLLLWPVDPFRPVRAAVADCYVALAAFAHEAKVGLGHGPERDVERKRLSEFQRRMRVLMEEARAALGATGARSAARTVRAHNLTVLLETADMLFAATLRWAELGEGDVGAEDAAALRDALLWLSGAESAVERGLRSRPADGAESFRSHGSDSLDHVRRRAEMLDRWREQPELQTGLRGHLLSDETAALLNVEVAFESLVAVWSGREPRGRLPETPCAEEKAPGWMELVRTNWTPESVMARHAVRMGIVGAVDVVLMRTLHVHHGSWMGMTSLIVLQPYGSGTLRKSAQRVGGTIAGGIMAAILVASIHNQPALIAVMTVTSGLTLATYAVDYAWYCFFLTPTFVLMSLPHLRDWQFAGTRILTTAVGAAAALLGVRVVWSTGLTLATRRLLWLGAVADAEYLRAMLQFWRSSDADRGAADRAVLAPARRRCGLAIGDAEETLDRLMLEPTLGWRSGGTGAAREEAMAFATYLRRFTRGVTTLAAVGRADERRVRWVEATARRLDAVAEAVARGTAWRAPEGKQLDAADTGPVVKAGIAEAQIRRLERQVGVLERTAAAITGGSPSLAE